MESTSLIKDQEDSKMEESLSPPPPWKLYHNPLYSPHPDPSISTAFSSSPSDLAFAGAKSLQTELEEARAQINDLKSELEFERGMRMKTEFELEEERARKEAVDRVNDELGIRVLGHEAEVSRIRTEIDEEKKMMRVAEVFREGKEKPYGVSPVSVLRRSASPEPENPHIRRGIKGSVEFQRVVKAMCSNKSNKPLGGNYKLECQKAQLKILLKQRSLVRPNNSYFIS